MREIAKWIGVDGLLHFLICYSMMLTLMPFIGVTLAILATTSVAIVKEVVDYCVEKDNDQNAVMHDMIMDAAGLIAAIVIYYI